MTPNSDTKDCRGDDNNSWSESVGRSPPQLARQCSQHSDFYMKGYLKESNVVNANTSCVRDVLHLGQRETSYNPRREFGAIKSEESRTRQHLSNISVMFGQVLVGIPVALYRPDHYSTNGEPNLSRFVLMIQKTIGRGVANLLPQYCASCITNPTASMYVLFSLILGVLIAFQYHYNRDNTSQGIFGIIGAAIVLILTALTYSENGGMHANAIVPPVAIATFTVSQIMDGVGRWASTSRAEEKLLRPIWTMPNEACARTLLKK